MNELYNKVLELKEKGFTHNDISKELNCSKSTVSVICNKYKDENNFLVKDLSDNIINSVIKMRKNGISYNEVRKNVTSEEGKKLMFKRDNETEGTFGDLKENMGYDRLYRRGHDNVQMEIYLVAMGHNIRKYQKLKKRIKETEEKQMKLVREMLRLFIC